MTIAAVLDQALKAAGIPIFGVRIPDPTNRSTWVVQFAPGATSDQQTQAAAIIAGLATDAATLADDDAQADVNQSKALTAVVIWVAQKLTIAPATAKQQILAIYKTL